MANAALELALNGKVFPGWNHLSLKTSIETAAALLTVEMPLASLGPVAPGFFITVDLVSEETRAPIAHLAGAKPRRVQFRKRMFTGWVETLVTSFGERGSLALLTGRSLSGLYMKVAPDIEPGEWFQVTVEQLASEFNRHVAPLGYPRIWRDFDERAVDELTGQPLALPVFERFALQPGETVWQAIERACRLCGLIAYASPGGDLVFSQPASRLRETAAEKVLQEGRNIREASVTRDISDRFHEYAVRGQRPATDEIYGSSASEVEGASTDEGITYFDIVGEAIPSIRTRKIILAEGAVDPDFAQRRAEWENTVSLARANRVTLRTAGLLVDPDYAGSGFWQINRLQRVNLPTLGLSRTLLITEVNYEADQRSGSTVELKFSVPEAYIPKPTAPQTEFEDRVVEETFEEDLLQ